MDGGSEKLGPPPSPPPPPVRPIYISIDSSRKEDSNYVFFNRFDTKVMLTGASWYIRYFWQGNHLTLGRIRCIYTVLANPSYVPSPTP